MANIEDYSPCYPVTVMLDFGTMLADPSMIMVAGQELVETAAELYPISFIGGCGRLKEHTMTLFFHTLEDARDFRSHWYIARARVLSKLARERYSDDPGDIPL